MIGFIVVFVRQ